MFISAFMSFRKLFNSNTNRNLSILTWIETSVVLGILFLIFVFILFSIVLLHFIFRWSTKSFSLWIQDVYSGLNLKWKWFTIVFFTWFLILRLLISINASLTGFFPPMYGAIAFLALMSISFFISGIMKLYSSWFD